MREAKFEKNKVNITFLAIFLCLVHLIDFILHSLIELSCVYKLAIVLLMLDQPKTTKMDFGLIRSIFAVFL